MNKKRIVIVEDNTAIREGFTALLNSTDPYLVVGKYANCEAAISRLSIDRPDIVLMDIDLPGINGIDGTLLIKKQLPTCNVLIITVYEDSRNVFQSLCAGASGYLVKNADLERIIERIEEVLAGGAPMSLSIARLVVESFQRQPDSPLSTRETEVLQSIAQGKSYTKIANELFVSKETVRSHIKNIYQKLAVSCKSDALRVASNNRWLSIKW